MLRFFPVACLDYEFLKPILGADTIYRNDRVDKVVNNSVYNTNLLSTLPNYKSIKRISIDSLLWVMDRKKIIH